MSRLYGWLAGRLHCCGCIITVVALPVVAASGLGTWAVLT